MLMIINKGKFKDNKLLRINKYLMWSWTYLLVSITTLGELSLYMEYLPDMAKPLKSFLEWPVTALLDKDRELW